nr:putative RNA-directed DNA polymerase, eukaryota, reverse transcriptase zinc-binding domain protein [Tanacetum cinerariifolium]
LEALFSKEEVWKVVCGCGSDKAPGPDEFNCIRVGEDGIMVSHLQYADDMIIFGERSRENASNMMNILKCFEEVLRLKINLRKTKVYGVGVDRMELDRMAMYMSCGVGEL